MWYGRVVWCGVNAQAVVENDAGGKEESTFPK